MISGYKSFRYTTNKVLSLRYTQQTRCCLCLDGFRFRDKVSIYSGVTMDTFSRCNRGALCISPLRALAPSRFPRPLRRVRVAGGHRRTRIEFTDGRLQRQTRERSEEQHLWIHLVVDRFCWPVRSPTIVRSHLLTSIASQHLISRGRPPPRPPNRRCPCPRPPTTAAGEPSTILH